MLTGNLDDSSDDERPASFATCSGGATVFWNPDYDLRPCPVLADAWTPVRGGFWTSADEECASLAPVDEQANIKGFVKIILNSTKSNLEALKAESY